jgi:hypothetical protein
MCLCCRHKHTLYAALDGKFQNTLKDKPHDLDEIALSDGHAYFVEDKPYREYLVNVENDAKVRLDVFQTVPQFQTVFLVTAVNMHWL